MTYRLILTLIGILTFTNYSAQNTNVKATSTAKAAYMIEIPPMSSLTDIPGPDEHQGAPIRRSGSNKFIEGKGYPKNGDPLMSAQKSVTKVNGRAPLASFDVHGGNATPTDPSGAVGPNHYVNAFNSGWGVRDRNGAVLLPEASLATLFPNEDLGDPIVVYDKFADRFIVMEFSDTPNGFLIAVCQGPDPVNDGWYTYRFNTGTFPDYEKLSIWGDGYYVTANKDAGTAGTSEVVWALERDEMLIGNPDAQVVGFPLAGITTSGFFSPAGFNANGDELPPAGNAPILYMQDDAWSGVTTDHLKVWNINVNWANTAASTISAPQIINTAPFDGVFDGGSFVNLPQPGNNDIDAIQATVMYMSQYRRFSNHNSCVINFVVDLNGNDNLAGIRWYELRQSSDGAPWEIYQEGTYTQPEGLSAFCGSIAQDKFGNIGLAYTCVGPNQAPCIRYTGRLSTDPLNVMTQAEDVIVNSNSSDPATRYGDYAQMTIDPLDDQTFWHIAEYFVGNTRTNRVGVFKLAPEFNLDAGVVSIDSPISSTLDGTESITVTIRNFGLDAISNVPVSYQIDGGTVVTGNYVGTIASDATVQYTFPTTANLGSLGTTYNISASTNLSGDEFADNDGVNVDVTNLAPIDLGVVAITNPYTASNLTGSENIIVTIENFGGESQSNFPISYTINGGTAVNELVPVSIAPGQTLEYTFTTSGNFAAIGDYIISSSTNIGGDANNGNNTSQVLVSNTLCAPAMFNLLTDCYSDTENSWRLETQAGALIQEVTSSQLAEETNYAYEFCLEPGCYKLVIEDTFGDGLNGGAFACSADGNYSFDLNGTTIITMGNPDFDMLIEHDFCVEGSSGTVVDLRAILEGAFNSSSQLMNDQLRENNQLPLQEPYTAFGFTQAGNGGGETTQASILDVTGNDAIVDWIFVELRDGENATSAIASQVALIQRDGDIVATDGVSPLTFNTPGVSSVYVVVRHRNHFGVRTGDAYVTSALIEVDFTNPSLNVFGTAAMTEVAGLNMLISGDANADGQVNSIDKNDFWRIENGQAFDYSNVKADFNLDGIVNSIDRNIFWRINNSKAQQLD